MEAKSEAKRFAESLGRYADRVWSYEDEENQEICRRVIPIDELRERAAKRINEGAEGEADGSGAPVSFRCPDAALAKELLHWFKADFFVWFHGFDCCGEAMTQNKQGIPTQEELDASAGRCGEWANAFTLCCRSIGLTARLILDWTDHVWTEVWSPIDSRWLHADSCEDVLDEPLLYEGGWGKKLNYIVSFESGRVLDRTWAYTNRRDEVMARRDVVEEEWLEQRLREISAAQRLKQSEAAARELDARIELEELGSGGGRDRNGEKETCAQPEPLPGRTSGSAQWIRARGEHGSEDDH